MMIAAVVSAANPCTGCNFTIRCPSVRMMRQPPAAEGMARTGGQSKPPSSDIPNEGGDDRAEHRRHRDDVGVYQAFADCRSNRAAKQRSGKIEKRRHRNRLAWRQNARRNDGGY